MASKKRVQMKLSTKQNRLTDLENQLKFAKEEEWRKRIIRELGMDMYVLLYMKWMTNRVLLHSTGNPSPGEGNGTPL